MSTIKISRAKYGHPLAAFSIDELFSPIREEYEKITGWKDMHQNAIIHHRISLYGEPCPKCGKPFRTPWATFCAECGKKSPKISKR